MDFCTYNSDDVDILVGGFYKVRGLSEGTYINIKKDLVTNTTVRSTDGIVARKKVVNSTFTIEVTTLQASPANNMFTRLWKLDNVTGMGKFPLMVRDASGTGYFFSPTVWIEDIPQLAYGTDNNDKTWILRADSGEINIGGNDRQTALLDAADLLLSGLPYVKQILDRVGV